MVNPSEFEVRYVRAEQRFYSWCAENLGSVGVVIAAALVSGLAFFSTNYITAGHTYFYRDTFGIIQLISFGIFTIIYLSLISFFIREKRQTGFQLISMVAVSVSATAPYVPSTSTLVSSVLTLGVIPGLCILGWVYLVITGRNGFSKKIALLYSIFHWAISLSFSYYLILDPKYDYVFRRFWMFKGFLLWILVIVRSVQAKVSAPDFLIAFNPVNGMKAVLWPETTTCVSDSEQQLKLKIWWNGISNIALGYSLFFLARNIQNTWGWRNIWSAYCVYCLVDIGMFNILGGSARLFGYKVRDATRFAFLARTPAEYWQRGSVYNFHFIQRYVFIPLFRIFKNRMLSMFFAFFVFFINHWGVGVLYSFTAYDVSSNDWHIEIQKGRAVQFLLYFILIYFSRRVWFYWEPFKSKWRPWLSIILTHLLQIGVLYVAFVQATHFLTAF